MKIALFKHLSTEHSDKFLINFERNGHVVGKSVIVNHSVSSWLTHSVQEEIGYALQKAAREADRDLAFIEHGDDYRAHCEITSNFWGPLSGEELDKLLA